MAGRKAHSLGHGHPTSLKHHRLVSLLASLPPWQPWLIAHIQFMRIRIIKMPSRNLPLRPLYQKVSFLQKREGSLWKGLIATPSLSPAMMRPLNLLSMTLPMERWWPRRRPIHVLSPQLVKLPWLTLATSMTSTITSFLTACIMYVI